jgi:hypothetical protein
MHYVIPIDSVIEFLSYGGFVVHSVGAEEKRSNSILKEWQLNPFGYQLIMTTDDYGGLTAL